MTEINWEKDFDELYPRPLHWEFFDEMVKTEHAGAMIVLETAENIKNFIRKVAQTARESGAYDARMEELNYWIDWKHKWEAQAKTQATQEVKEKILVWAGKEKRLTANCICSDDGTHYFCDKSYNQALSDFKDYLG